MTFHDDVGEFHEKFDLPRSEDGGQPTHLDRSALAFRVGFMLEELCEFNRAASQDDLAGMLDALVDLIYVASGTAHLMRLPLNEAWAEVHRANLAKERGPTATRGHALDVRKPPGWVAPDLDRIIREHLTRLTGQRSPDQRHATS